MYLTIINKKYRLIKFISTKERKVPNLKTVLVEQTKEVLYW